MSNPITAEQIERLSASMKRDAIFLAEAKDILAQGEYIAMHIIMQLMKDAGYEPDDEGNLTRKK